MKIADLDQDCLAAVKSVRWDGIIEKHEGPENWESALRWYDPEFMLIEGQLVLLPVERYRHDNITILRTIWSADRNSLTLFLKDTTYGDDMLTSGFMAVCDRMVDRAFYLAIVYHEWFIIEPSSVMVSGGSDARH